MISYKWIVVSMRQNNIYTYMVNNNNNDKKKKQWKNSVWSVYCNCPNRLSFVSFATTFCYCYSLQHSIHIFSLLLWHIYSICTTMRRPIRQVLFYRERARVQRHSPQISSKQNQRIRNESLRDIGIGRASNCDTNTGDMPWARAAHRINNERGIR